MNRVERDTVMVQTFSPIEIDPSQAPARGAAFVNAVPEAGGQGDKSELTLNPFIR